MQIRSGEGPKKGRKRMRSRERSKRVGESQKPVMAKKEWGRERKCMTRRGGMEAPSRSEEKTPEAEEGKEEHDPGKCESDLTHGKS